MNQLDTIDIWLMVYQLKGSHVCYCIWKKSDLYVNSYWTQNDPIQMNRSSPHPISLDTPSISIGGIQWLCYPIWLDQVSEWRQPDLFRTFSFSPAFDDNDNRQKWRRIHTSKGWILAANEPEKNTAPTPISIFFLVLVLVFTFGHLLLPKNGGKHYGQIHTHTLTHTHTHTHTHTIWDYICFRLLLLGRFNTLQHG